MSTDENAHSDDVPPDFSGLRALFINCTLKRSPEVSNTQALVDAGYDVSVIAPRAEGQRRREDLAQLRIHRYFATRERPNKVGFVFEFASAWVRARGIAAQPTAARSRSARTFLIDSPLRA